MAVFKTRHISSTIIIKEPLQPSSHSSNHNKKRISVNPTEINTSNSNNNGIAHGWLEAMRDLSPPRISRRLQSDLPDKSDCEAAEINYRAWMVRVSIFMTNFMCEIQISNYLAYMYVCTDCALL